MGFCCRKTNSPVANSEPQDVGFPVPRSSKRKPPDDYTVYGGHNRQRVGTEAHYLSGFSCRSSSTMAETGSILLSGKRGPPSEPKGSRCDKRRKVGSEACGFGFSEFSTMARSKTQGCTVIPRSSALETSKTHFSNVKGNSRDNVKGAITGSDEYESKEVKGEREEQKQKEQMDRRTRLQCWAILKRLMIHPDGRAFKELTYSNDLGDSYSCETVTKPIIGLETIQSKLNKGLYFKADEFAADIRLTLTKVMQCPSNIRGINRMALKLREEFEKRWKPLKERWAAENGENNGQKDSMGYDCPKVPPLSQHNVVSNKLEPSRKVKMRVSKVAESLASKAGQNSVKEVHEKKASSMPQFVDLSKDNSQGKEKENEAHKRAAKVAQLKKEREAARVALEQMKRTADIEDNLKIYEELELLCGPSILCHPLKSLGLYLKY